MIKTVTLSGTELEVTGLAGQNTIIRNLGGTSVYARASPGVEPDADGVLEIPAGSAANLYGTNGTVCLLGNEKVQLTGTDYNDLNCTSMMGGSGDAGSSGVSQTYVDSRDNAVLKAAKEYADNKLFFSTFLKFPNIGEADKLYIDKGAKELYIWDPDSLIYVNIGGFPDELTIEVTI